MIRHVLTSTRLRILSPTDRRQRRQVLGRRLSARANKPKSAPVLSRAELWGRELTQEGLRRRSVR